jgi:transcriptional regulator of acetoin/glycerol metabolism
MASDREPSSSRDARHEPIDLREARAGWVKSFEQEYLSKLMARHRGNVSAAARSAGVDRSYLVRLLKRNGYR